MSEPVALSFLQHHLRLRTSDHRRSLMSQHIFSGPIIYSFPRLGAGDAGVNQAQPSPCKILSKRGLGSERITKAENCVPRQGRPSRAGVSGRFCRRPFLSSLRPPHLPQGARTSPHPGPFLSASHISSHLILTATLEVGTVTILISPKRKPRHRKAEELVQGHATIGHTEAISLQKLSSQPPPRTTSVVPMGSLGVGAGTCASLCPTSRVQCPAQQTAHGG